MPITDTRQSELPLLLTIRNASFQLSVCERQIYELAAAGLLVMVKIGRKSSRITRESILRLAAQRGEPTKPVSGLKQFKPRQAPHERAGTP